MSGYINKNNKVRGIAGSVRTRWKRQSKNYSLSDSGDKLYYSGKTKKRDRFDDAAKREVPRNVVRLEEMMFQCFESPEYGGFIIKMAGGKFRKKYFFEGIDDIFKEYINMSDAYIKRGKGTKFGRRIRKMQQSERPGMAIVFDHSELPECSETGLRYIFVVVDVFTKYLWVFASATMDAEECARFVYQIYMEEKFQHPERWHCDNGKPMNNFIFDALSTIFNVIQKHGAMYNPRPQGQCEKENGVFKEKLKMLNDHFFPGEVRWGRFITRLISARNCTPRATLPKCTTPFFMVKRRVPGDEMICDDQLFDSFACDTAFYDAIFKSTREKQSKIQQKYLDSRNSSIKHQALNVGDKVYYATENANDPFKRLKHKYMPKFHKHGCILQIRVDGRVKIKDDTTGDITNWLDGNLHCRKRSLFHVVHDTATGSRDPGKKKHEQVNKDKTGNVKTATEDIEPDVPIKTESDEPKPEVIATRKVKRISEYFVVDNDVREWVVREKVSVPIPKVLPDFSCFNNQDACELTSTQPFIQTSSTVDYMVSYMYVDNSCWLDTSLEIMYWMYKRSASFFRIVSPKYRTYLQQTFEAQHSASLDNSRSIQVMSTHRNKIRTMLLKAKVIQTMKSPEHYVTVFNEFCVWGSINESFIGHNILYNKMKTFMCRTEGCGHTRTTKSRTHGSIEIYSHECDAARRASRNGMVSPLDVMSYVRLNGCEKNLNCSKCKCMRVQEEWTMRSFPRFIVMSWSPNNSAAESLTTIGELHLLEAGTLRLDNSGVSREYELIAVAFWSKLGYDRFHWTCEIKPGGDNPGWYVYDDLSGFCAPIKERTMCTVGSNPECGKVSGCVYVMKD